MAEEDWEQWHACGRRLTSGASAASEEPKARSEARCTRLLGPLPTVTSTLPYPHRRNSREQESDQGVRRRFLTLTHQTVWGSASADSYPLGSYRIATAPEPNSSRLTSFKSTCFDSPANNVGPWPASLGCTTNSYSSINPSSANASGSFTPPTSSPLPDSRLSC